MTVRKSTAPSNRRPTPGRAGRSARRILSLGAAALALAVLGAAPALAATIDCPAIPLSQCLEKIQTAFGVTVHVDTQAAKAITRANIETADPFAAVKAAFDSADGITAAFEYDKARKVVTVTLIGAAGALVPPSGAQEIPPAPTPQATAAPRAQDSVKAVPSTPEIPAAQTAADPAETQDGVKPPFDVEKVNKAIEEASKQSEDPDEIINLPGDTGQQVTRRHLRDVLAKEAAKPLDLDQPVMPNQSPDSAITMRQLQTIQKEQDKNQIKPNEVILPDGSVRTLESLQQPGKSQ